MTGAIDLSMHKHRDASGAKIGMWLFLFTELLLFGGMFLLYSVYRLKYSHEFHTAALELNQLFGTINTIILLTSSLTVVLSITALKQGNRKLAIVFLVLTILFAFAFLGIKYVEWGAKFHHGIYPNSPELLSKYSHGEILFFGLYFTMTGLHGLHVIIGIVVLSVMLFFISRRPVTQYNVEHPHLEKLKGTFLGLYGANGEKLWQGEEIDDSISGIDIKLYHSAESTQIDPSHVTQLENSGLYWHLVDIIWIFLFPLFYLIT